MKYTDEVVRELSLEKEIELYAKESDELFSTEAEDCEQPFANCIVRRGNRIIKKAMQNIATQRAELEKRQLINVEPDGDDGIPQSVVFLAQKELDRLRPAYQDAKITVEKYEELLDFVAKHRQ